MFNKIRFQKGKYSFFYTDNTGDEHELTDESAETVYCIRDEKGKWSPDNHKIGLRCKYSLRTFNCLFGEQGIACHDAKLGLAIQWTSSDSRQRGIIKIGQFMADDDVFTKDIKEEFSIGQLRGEVSFTTIMYIAQAGNPNENERHLVNTNGYVLGELDSCTIRLDGTASSFPIYEVSEPGQPLWRLDCEWDDPTVDAFSETISINLNTSHKHYSYIDVNSDNYDRQLLIEIMSSAITLIIEKLRSDDYLDQVTRGEDLSSGSVGQAIYYFMNTLEWDLSSAEKVSLSARKFFDQRI